MDLGYALKRLPYLGQKGNCLEDTMKGNYPRRVFKINVGIKTEKEVDEIIKRIKKEMTKRGK